MSTRRSAICVLDSDDEETLASQRAARSAATVASKHAPPPAKKRKLSSPSSTPKPRKAAAKDINAVLMASSASKLSGSIPHSTSLHSTASMEGHRLRLMEWYNSVRHSRGMPWRKDYDAQLLSTKTERTQRGYEVLVSEIMLQQTQIATVIPYYNAWMSAFPTIEALASADIEAVNQRWKGLGYYSRAARLLAAAKKLVDELDGEFSRNAKEMEKELPGVGKYTAGAISSIINAERTPAVDGNVFRLLSRLLALHAPLSGTSSKIPVDFIWSAAAKLIEGCTEDEDAAAFNQALIELGSTVCKPTNPACGACPLNEVCAAYKLSKGKTVITSNQDSDIEDICKLCEPFPDASSRAVTRFPMKVEKKKAREEDSAVRVIEWRQHTDADDRWFILVKRPDTGLLAGLYEFPTLDHQPSVSLPSHAQSTTTLLGSFVQTTPDGDVGSSSLHRSKDKDAGSLLHVFSHIRKTYHIRWILLIGGDKAPELLQPESAPPSSSEEDKDELKKKKRKVVKKNGKGRREAGDTVRVKWVKLADIEAENISTGALKIWKQVGTKCL